MEHTYRTRLKRVLAIFMAVLMVVTSLDMIPVTARAENGKTSVSLNYSVYTLKKGKTLKLKAAVSSKDKKIVWKSSRKSVATVTQKGVVKALKKGKATITATIKGTKIKATCKISVGTPVKKVQVTNNKITLKVGKTTTIKPDITPSNATNKGVTYVSSQPSVATVSSKGVVAAKSAGKTVITVVAKDGSDKKAKVTVTVEDQSVTATTTEKKTDDKETTEKRDDPGTGDLGTVEVTGVSFAESQAVLGVGEKKTFTATVLPTNATNKEVTYVSRDTNVARVDAGTGEVTGWNVGQTDIEATTKDGGKKATYHVVVGVMITNLTMRYNKLSAKKGDTVSLEVTIVPDNATLKELVWKSSKESVATVDSQGRVKTLAEGNTIITVSSKYGTASASCVLRVTTSVTNVGADLDGTTLTEAERTADGTTAERVTMTDGTAGETTTERATNADGTAGETTTERATNADGTAGETTTERATNADGTAGETTTERAMNADGTAGKTATERATTEATTTEKATTETTTTEKATTEATTTEKATTEATTTEKATTETATTEKATTETTTTEKATTEETVKESQTINVTSVSFSESQVTLGVGKKNTLTANVLPADATNKEVTYSSRNTDIARVNADTGEVTGWSVGETDIEAVTEDGEKTAVYHVVVGVMITNLTFRASRVTAKVGATVSCMATIAPDNATLRDLDWTSSEESVATVDDQGNVTTLAAGSTIIKVSAKYGGVSAIYKLTVTEQ